jgi:uncharacterized protein (TIGR02145 family)
MKALSLLRVLNLAGLILIGCSCSKDIDPETNKQNCGKGSGYPVEFCNQVDHFEAGYGVKGQDWIIVTCLVGPSGATVSNTTNGIYYCSGSYKLTTFDTAVIDIGWGGTVEIGSPTEDCTISRGEGTFQVSVNKLNGGEGNLILSMSSGSLWMFTTVIVNTNCNVVQSPSGLKGTYDPDLNKVFLVWKDNSLNETGFEVQRSDTENSGYIKIADLAANTTEYADATVASGKTYYYRVYAKKGTAYSEFAASAKVAAVNQFFTDIDNNRYPYLDIGTQVWMTENLKTTHYRDGTPIPLVTGNSEWESLKTGAWCVYNNDTTHLAVYGRLYNWYAAAAEQGLCPAGWHIPTEAEWNILLNYLGGQNYAGGKMKEEGTSHWISPNTGANNKSGFTALPGGLRTGTGTWLTNGQHNLGYYTGFWSYNPSDTPSAVIYSISLSTFESAASAGSHYKTVGFSIRCLKD